MTRARKLTEIIIANLPLAAAGKRYEKPDGQVANLFVRVGSRKKKFVLIARFGGAKNSARRTIGRFPRMSLERARQTATAWNAMIERGLDPQQEEQRIEKEAALRRERTFRSAMEEYLAWMPARKYNRRALKDVKAIRFALLDPAKNPWLDKPMAEVSAKEVVSLVEAISGRGAPGAARNTFQYLSSFFCWMMLPERKEFYGLQDNPIRDIRPKLLDLDDTTRRRILDVDEVRAYWKVAEATPYPWGPLFKGLLLTLVRDLELAGMRWPEVDWTEKLWTVPEERVKNGHIHLVPLSDAMIALLREIKRQQPPTWGDCVFSTQHGQIPISGPGGKVTGAFRARVAAALSEMRPGAVMEPWVLHDDRRSGYTMLLSLRVQKDVIETILGHGPRGIEAVYNQYRYLPESRAALSRMADQLAEVIAGTANSFYPRGKN